MGQRFQVFVKMQNPTIKLVAKYKSINKHQSSKEEIENLQAQIEKYKEAFGSNRFTTFAWHHQWLYGRSALVAAQNILHLSKYASEDTNPFSNDSSYEAEELISITTHCLSLFNNKLAMHIGRYGIEGFRFLNFQQPEIRNDISLGDNNDGILVINTLNNSYCFLNIGGDSTINQLPKLVPVDAAKYVRLYYPEIETDSTTANLPESIKERQQVFINNNRINKLFIKELASYKVLNKQELIKMFPKTFNEDKCRSI
jgi:hypothetical protein